MAELEKETGERFEVVLVKEKLGTLRFYVSHHSDAIDERIAEAQKESSRTCEVCGQPGKQRKTGGGFGPCATSRRRALGSHKAITAVGVAGAMRCFRYARPSEQETNHEKIPLRGAR